MIEPTTDRPTDPIRDAFEAMLWFLACLIGPLRPRKITPAEEIGAAAACEVETDFEPDEPPAPLLALRDLVQRAADEHERIRAAARERLDRVAKARRERKAADLAAGRVTDAELADIAERTAGPGPLAGDGELLRRCRAEIRRLTTELASHAKAATDWRDTAMRHDARAEAVERDLTALRAATEGRLPDETLLAMGRAQGVLAAIDADFGEIRWAADQLRPYGAEARVDFGGAGQAIRSLLAAVDTVLTSIMHAAAQRRSEPPDPRATLHAGDPASVERCARCDKPAGSTAVRDDVDTLCLACSIDDADSREIDRESGDR